MEPHLNTIAQAQKTCWAHIEVATKMVENLDALRGLRFASATPILSSFSPSLMITPEHPDDIVSLRTLCREIQAAMKVEIEWQHIPMNDEWLLRLEIPSRIRIDVMTLLPAYKETPIEL